MTGVLIDSRHLGHTYADGTRALRDLTFRIDAGESVAVIGANGAGKSTLLQHLVGHLRPTAGELRVGGQRVEQSSLAEIRRRVGMVFQDPDDQLFMPTVAEDVAFGLRNQGLAEAEVRVRVDRILHELGIEALRHRPPGRLSGGEKKRVALAGVLAMAPDVLVMDEPSNGLDPVARRELMQLIKPLARTLILASHDLDLVLALCPRTLVLCNGELVADGPTADIFSSPERLGPWRLELPLGMQACPRCGAMPR